ncbi:MAG: hypothetical protein M3Z26_02265 [Bacteroidota bacterium]|nr:hypothetical protein [Bacteroidota bacterium]
MKTLLRLLILTGITVGTLNIAQAQRSRSDGRGGDHGDHGNRSSGNSQSRGSVSNSRERNYTPQRNATTRTMPQRNFNTGRVDPQRSVAQNQAYSRSNSASRGNDRYNNRYDNNYRTSNNYYGGRYYRNGYGGYHTAFMYGPRYSYIPHNSISIYFGGSPYYYNQGYFYGYYGGYYQPLFPPFGLRIGVLPFGYSRFYVGVDPFFYYNGIYYRQYDNNNYEVVDAPMGATVSSLPKGAKQVVVNGEKLYELNGTYYKADRDSKGNDVFTVVGKNGEINNTDENNNNVNNSQTTPPSGSLQMGDIIDQLPEGSKIVTINGDKVYVAPDDTYFKEESNNGIVQYRVVGK